MCLHLGICKYIAKIGTELIILIGKLKLKKMK